MMMNRISKKKYSWFIPFSLFQIDKKGFKQDLDPEYIHSSIVIAFCSIEQKHDEKAKKNVMEYFEITRHESNKVYIWILLMNPLIWKKKKKKKQPLCCDEYLPSWEVPWWICIFIWQTKRKGKLLESYSRSKNLFDNQTESRHLFFFS